MEMNIIENKASKLVFELDGAGHTFCNALKDALREDDSVNVATYNITHPLQGKPKFFLETKSGTKPKDALDAAIKNLKKKNSTFLKTFDSMK